MLSVMSTVRNQLNNVSALPVPWKENAPNRAARHPFEAASYSDAERLYAAGGPLLSATLHEST